MPPERAAQLVGMLLGTQVSAGWADKAGSRLSARLGKAGFDEAMLAALAGEKTLAADETSVNVPGKDASRPRPPAPGHAHEQERDPEEKGRQGRRAGDIITTLREAYRAVEAARARGDTAPDPRVLDDLRERYDQAVRSGIIFNRLRDWHDGNHPGYALAAWLTSYKEQVFLFTRDFTVEWTNNVSGRGAKAAKRHQAVSGYWHSLATLARWCRMDTKHPGGLVGARPHKTLD